MKNPLPVARPAVGDNTYSRLRDLIVRGRLEPGRPLVEQDVASELRVSRTPVREALRLLHRDGLATFVGGGERPRLAVAPLSREAVIELYQAAAALEGISARALVSLPRATRVALANRMKAHDRAFRREAERPAPDWDALFTHHDRFHRELQDASAGARVRALLEILRPQIDRYEWFFAPLTGPDFSATYAEHANITSHIPTGTRSQIERAVRTNWLNGARRLSAVVERADVRLLTGRMRLT